MKLIDTTNYSVFSDLPGYTLGGGSVPPELCVALQKPGIVIEDKNFGKSLVVSYLSFPWVKYCNSDSKTLFLAAIEAQETVATVN